MPFAPQHKDDFGVVYNLPDPRPYYSGLRPVDYRMPEVLGRTLRRLVPWYVSARRLFRAPVLMDFAAGFGAVGAMLRHRLSMRALYAYYARAKWRPEWPRELRGADRDWYGMTRLAAPGELLIIGADVADEALGYAESMGLIDVRYDVDLASQPVSADLERRLSELDLVVEAGSVGPVQAAAFGALLDAGARPWFLRCPRPDVDWSSLETVFARYGYRSEPLGTPVRYRQLLSEAERAQSARAAAALGSSAAQTFLDGYLSVSMRLTRPEPDAARWSAADICSTLALDELCG